MRNILADGEVQEIKEIVEITKSMWASEKTKFIAFKITKKGLKSMKRQKFKKKLQLVKALTHVKELREYFSTSMAQELGNIGESNVDDNVIQRKSLDKKNEKQNDEDISKIKQRILDLEKNNENSRGPRKSDKPTVNNQYILFFFV